MHNRFKRKFSRFQFDRIKNASGKRRDKEEEEEFVNAREFNLVTRLPFDGENKCDSFESTNAVNRRTLSDVQRAVDDRSFKEKLWC